MPKIKTGPMTIEDTNNAVLTSAAQTAMPASEAPPPPLTLSQVNAFIECAKMGYNMNVDADRYMQILQAARSWLKQARGDGGKVRPNQAMDQPHHGHEPSWAKPNPGQVQAESE